MSTVYVVFEQCSNADGVAYNPVKAFSSKQRADEMAAQLKENVRKFCPSLLSVYERESQAIWDCGNIDTFKYMTDYYNHIDILIDELEDKLLSENNGKTWMDDVSELVYTVVPVDYE